MIHDVLTVFYLFWPVIFILAFGIFLAGFFFALSLGGLFAIGLLLAYYGFIQLKKRGFFDWLLGTQKRFSETILANARKTFLLKGNLDSIPNQPVLYIAHPHGLFSMAPFLHWAAQVTDWPFQRKVHVAMHSIFFHIPIIRECAEYFGAIEATEEEIRKYLEQGDSVVLLTGGIRELNQTEPGKMKLVLSKRKGFARVAQSLGVPIVPVLTFGENELFPPLQGYFVSLVQSYLYRFFHVSVPLPTWESVKNWFLLLKGPLSPPVETWFGSPILTKDKKSETIRNEVLKEFRQLYQKGRPHGFPLTLDIL